MEHPNSCPWQDKIGKIKTTKSEFASLGPDAWWMHEKCMTAEERWEPPPELQGGASL